MAQSNWLSKNVRSVIGLMVIVYGLNFFSLILVMKLGSAQLIDRMETSLNNLIMFVLGYYFSANHNANKQTDLTTDSVTITKTETTNEKPNP